MESEIMEITNDINNMKINEKWLKTKKNNFNSYTFSYLSMISLIFFIVSM